MARPRACPRMQAHQSYLYTGEFPERIVTQRCFRERGIFVFRAKPLVPLEGLRVAIRDAEWYH